MPRLYGENAKSARSRKSEVVFINKAEGSTNSSRQIKKELQVAFCGNRKDLKIRVIKETRKGLVFANDREIARVITEYSWGKEPGSRG